MFVTDHNETMMFYCSLYMHGAMLYPQRKKKC